MNPLVKQIVKRLNKRSSLQGFFFDFKDIALTSYSKCWNVNSAKTEFRSKGNILKYGLWHLFLRQDAFFTVTLTKWTIQSLHSSGEYREYFLVNQWVAKIHVYC